MPEMHEPFIETDAAGRLYDRRVREHLRRDVPENEVAATEALAALRLASHGFRNRSGSLAIFAAIRRAFSLIGNKP